ncbi:DUF1385 domain-containing protein [Candidatus Bathyarchaeota archaeon]|nr:DUF1385 domain-containing protein [Candidatus Bathyarchaeota archaeon]
MKRLDLFVAYDMIDFISSLVPVYPMTEPQGEREEQSFAFGGQALIEGVMMRSRSHLVMCVRRPDGEIATHSQEVSSLTRRNRVLGLPVVRGVVAMLEAMYWGMKGIFHSADVALEEEQEEFGFSDYLLVLALVVVISSVFMVVPFILTNYLHLEGFMFSLVEALVRLAMFTGYLYAISRWGEMRRVLQYHGAEHKAINAYEAGAQMTVEEAAAYPRIHPRCGTSFLFIVVLISVVVFSLIPSESLVLRIAYRVLLIPVLAGVSFEVLRLSDKYRDSAIIRLMTVPGLAFQRLTTKEPEPDMIEVAIRALDEVKRLEEAQGGE